jgi:hypothetical protein
MNVPKGKKTTIRRYLRVTRLGDFLLMGLLLEAHCDFLKG